MSIEKCQNRKMSEVLLHIHSISWSVAIALALFVGGIFARKSMTDAVIGGLATFLVVLAVMEGLRHADLWSE